MCIREGKCIDTNSRECAGKDTVKGKCPNDAAHVLCCPSPVYSVPSAPNGNDDDVYST